MIPRTGRTAQGSLSAQKKSRLVATRPAHKTQSFPFKEIVMHDTTRGPSVGQGFSGAAIATSRGAHSPRPWVSASPVKAPRPPAARTPDAPRGAFVDKARGFAKLWVVAAGRTERAFNDLDDAHAHADEWNETHLPDPDEATIRQAACVVSEVYEPRPGCRLIAVEVPREFVDALAQRCVDVGINPNRMISALLLTHLNRMTPDSTGEGQVRALESWESGRRRIRNWPATPQAQVDAEGGVA